MYLLRGGGGRVKVCDSPCFNTYETLSSVNPTIVLWFIKKEKKNFFFSIQLCHMVNYMVASGF